MSLSSLRFQGLSARRRSNKSRKSRNIDLGSRLDYLEARITPATFTWTGLGGDTFWSTEGNWDLGAAPANNDDLVFPASASRLTNFNDLVNFQAHSIELSGNDYMLSGNLLTVSASISTTYSSGSSVLAFDINMDNATFPIDVAAGGSLEIDDALGNGEGASNLVKTGGGTLLLGSQAANTFTGSTTVSGGVLQFAKPSGSFAINGPLIISDNATAQLLGSNQFPNTSTVAVGIGATLDLNDFDQTTSGLSLTGGTVATGSGTLTLGGDVTVNSSSTTAVIAGHLDLGSSIRTFQIADSVADYELNVTGIISGSGGIDKTGTGVLNLAGSNIYSGQTYIDAGGIRAENSSAFGTAEGNTVINNGASVYFAGNGLSFNEDFITFGSGNNSDGVIDVLYGTTTLAGKLGLPNGDVEIKSYGLLTISGVIDDFGDDYSPNYTVGSSGMITITGDNTYTSDTALRSGIIRAESDNAFGRGSFASTVSVLDGATLQLDTGITLPSSKTIAISGVPVDSLSKIMNIAAINTIQGDIAITGGNNVAFDVASGSTLYLDGVISGSRDYDKNGSGTLVLTGTSTHTGNVNVGDGRLLVNGDISSSNKVFVDGILGGTGVVPNLELSAIGTLSPGNSPGAIHTGSVTFDSGSTYSVELNGAVAGTTYDQTIVTGTVTLSNPTLNVSLGYTPSAHTVFKIIDNDGSDAVSGTFNGLAEGSTITIGIQSFTISYVGGDGNDVTLTANLRTDTWTGAGGDANWTTAANWLGNVAPSAGDQLIFPSSPSSLTSTNDFPFGTTFDSIVIQGVGYSFSGITIGLDEGITTTYSSGSQNFPLQVILNADQQIDVATGGTLNIQGAISGSYSLTKSGNGVLQVSSPNNYSGGTTINAGTLNLTSSNTFLGSGSVTVTAGATLGFSGNAFLQNTLFIGGSGYGGGGALRTYGNNSSDVISSNITLTSDLYIFVATSSQFGFNGKFGGNYSISTAGGGSISIGGSVSNTFGGSFTQANNFVVVSKSGGATTIPHDLIINSGTFLSQRDEQISDTATVYLAAGAEFDLLNANEKIGAIDFTGGALLTNGSVLTLNSGGTITSHAASSTATLAGRIDFDGGQCVITTAAGTPSNGNDLTISADLLNGSLQKLGAGNLALNPSSSSTYSGGTDIQAGKVTISRNTSFGTGAVSILNATVQITSSIAVNNNFSIDSNVLALSNTSGSNTLTGTIAIANDLQISTNNSTTLTLSGAISDGGGGYSLSKSGNGTLVLNGSNSYFNTNVNAGVLQVGSSDATGTTGLVSLATGTSIQQVTSNYALPTSGLSLAGSTTYFVSGSSAYTVSGGINLTGVTTFDIGNSSATLTASGIIGGSFGFTKVSSGRLTLTGANTFTGNVTVTAGSISVGNATALGTSAGSTTINDGATLDLDTSSTTTIAEPITIGSAGGSATITQTTGSNTLTSSITLVSKAIFNVTGGSLTISGAIGDGASSFGIDKSGSSTLILTGANTYDGLTSILAGSLVAGSSAALGSTIGGTVISDGAFLKLDIAAGATINEPMTVGTSGGSAGIENIQGNNILSGAVLLVSTGALVATGDSLEFSGVISDGSGTFGLTLSGTKDLILSGANTFDGSVQLNGGRTILRNASGLGSTTSGTLISSTALLQLDLAGTFSLNEPFTLSGAATLENIAGNNTLAGPIVLTAAENFQVTGGQLTLTGPLSGSGGLNKLGTGTLFMSGHSSFAGNTHILAGTLSAGLSDTLSNTNVVVDSGSTLGIRGGITLGVASITLSGSGLNGVGALDSTSGDNVFNGAITLSGAADIGVDLATLTLNGVITGSGNFNKVGSSKLILTASNSLSGSTTIVQGSLEARNNNALSGSTSVHISTTGQLLVKDVTISQPISIDGYTTGLAAIDGLGTLSTLSGQIFINTQFNVGAESGNTLVISGVVSDSGDSETIVKLGPGIVQFTNSNNIISPGSLLITQAGQVLVTNASALGSSALQAQSGGEFVLMGGVTVTNDIQISGNGPNGNGAIRNAGGNNVLSGNISLTGDSTIGVQAGSLELTGVISDNGGTPYSITKLGTGALTLDGNNTYSGSTSVTAGTLFVNGSMGTGTITVSSGATLGGHGTTGPVIVNAGGFYSPGNSPNTITVASLTLAGASTYVEEIDGSSPGNGTTGYDKTIVTAGPVILAGATLSASIGGGYTPIPGDVLTIIDNQSNTAISGIFNGYAEGSLLTLTGFNFRVSYVGGTGNDLTLTYVAPTTTVVTSSPNPTVFGQSVTLTATVSSVPAGFIPGGSISFFEGTTLLATANLDGSGQATLTTSSFSAGLHGITAVYGGATSFFGSTSPIYLQGVNKADTSVGLTTSNAGTVFGQSVSFTATVSAVAPGAGLPSGNVMFLDGSAVLGVVSLANVSGTQTALFTTSAIVPGNHTITAQYLGDLSFNGNNASRAQSVSKANTSVSVASAGNTVYGQVATFTATISAIAPGAGSPSGTVTFYDGLTTLGTGSIANGIATFTTSSLSVANHSITAAYTSGDANFNVSATSQPISQIVDMASTSTVLISSISPSAFGQSVTITATVTTTLPGAGIASGTVNFTDGSTLIGSATLSSGVATFTTSAFSVGAHTLRASYTGNSIYQPSTSSNLTQFVNKAATIGVVTSTLSPAIFGQSVTFTTIMTSASPGAGTPNGTVTFMDGTTTLGTSTLDGSGVATLTTNSLAAGAHAISAVYNGGANFLTTTTSQYQQVVNKSGVGVTVTTGGTKVFGQSASFVITLTPSSPGAGIPTGFTTLMDGTTVLSIVQLVTVGGIATGTFSTSNLAAGSHTITALYQGDGSFDAAFGSTLQQVNAAATTTSFSGNLSTVYGQAATLTATVSVVSPGAGTPSGSVQFLLDGIQSLGTANIDANGIGSISTSVIPVGAHTVLAIYSSSGSNFSGSSSPSLNAQVSKDGTTTTLGSSVNPSVFGQSITFTASVNAAAPGSGVPTGVVTFYDGTTQLGTALLSSGLATLTTSFLSRGSHSITAAYTSGDSQFTASLPSVALAQFVNFATTSTSMTSAVNPSTFGESVTFTATVTVNPSGAGTPTGIVTFYDHVYPIGTGRLVGGTATFSTPSLGVGHHDITAVYSSGDDSFAPSLPSAITDQVVVKAGTSASLLASVNPSVFGQAVTFTATITAISPGAGTPTGMVTFYNGLTALGVANLSNSIATFTTSSLPVGTDSITVVYATGDSNFDPAAPSSPINMTVNAAQTTTTLIGARNPELLGGTVTFTATTVVNTPGAGTPSGSIQFFDGSTLIGTATLTAGSASLTTSTLGAGDHLITANFIPGDLNTNASSSSPLTESIVIATSSVGLSGTLNPSSYGQSVTLTAVVTTDLPLAGVPTGVVTFLDGNTVLATTPLTSAGIASISLNTLGAGTHAIRATYSGATAITPGSSAMRNQVVVPATTSTTIFTERVRIGGKYSQNLVARIANLTSGTIAPSGTVSLFTRGKLLTSFNVANGLGRTPLARLRTGMKNITAVFQSTNFATSTTANPKVIGHARRK